MLLSINPKNPQPRLVQQVVELLENDGVIIYPTDTGIWSGMQHFQQKSDETFASDQKDGSQKTIDSHLFKPDSDSGIHSGY